MFEYILIEFHLTGPVAAEVLAEFKAVNDEYAVIFANDYARSLSNSYLLTTIDGLPVARMAKWSKDFKMCKQ